MNNGPLFNAAPVIDEEEFGLGDLLGIVVENRWLISATTVLALVIGGIYKVTSDQGEDRVPGLANIPVLGHLFKNKRRSDENEELLIFITPRVIKL